NNYILKTDTAGIKVFLSFPCDTEPCNPRPVPLSGSEVKWYPATESAPFTVEFRPANLANGVYTLRVEATDSQSNSSGSEPYEIQFTINSETSVTINDPYPNPFVNEVYFKVVITGDVLPDAFDMQIMDVNGRVLGHFGNYEDPSFHTGTNELSWNGTDSRGNPLPNGVYVFKMMLYVKETVVQKIGKLVLVRTQE
ncbi:MAG TPA: hypothetical protein VFZ52_23055, partial [Chryseolinea sp.]